MSRRILGVVRYDLGVAVRNGEQLLLVLGIPVLLLVFFANVDVLPTGDGEPIDFLAPGVLALAVMSTAMTNLAIGLGFDREYGFLVRLGVTPLRRGELLAGKVLLVLVQLAVQLVVLLPASAALGWDPDWSGLSTLLGATVLGAVAFGAVGFLLAGSFRGLLVLAAANALYVVLLLVGGMVIDLAELPSAIANVAELLPPAALAELFRDAFGGAEGDVARAWTVLAVWASLAPLVAARAFRWAPTRA
ncbi:MAG: ABC transporter permease [Actinomycetota bacterium]